MNGLQNNQALYDRIAAELGPDNLLLNTQPTCITRHANYVEIAAQRSNNNDDHSEEFLIKARKLVLAIPPVPENLTPFLDLSAHELSLFRQLNGSCYWNSIVRNAGLPASFQYTNIDPANPLDLPAVPGLYAVVATPFPGVVAAYYGAPGELEGEVVKGEILEGIKRLRGAGGGGGAGGEGDEQEQVEPEIVEFNPHNPYHLTVSAEAIRGGFYAELEALQGQRNTWYTGAAWNKPATSAIWNFTEYQLLPRILADLGGGVEVK
jgi:hypothetical protein